MDLTEFSEKELKLLLELLNDGLSIEKEMKKFKFRGIDKTFDNRKYYELMKVKINNHLGEYE